MSSFLKQSFYNTCFIIKYNNRFVNNRICNAKTRNEMKYPTYQELLPGKRINSDF